MICTYTRGVFSDGHTPTVCGQSSMDTRARASIRQLRVRCSGWRPGTCTGYDLPPAPHFNASIASGAKCSETIV